MTLPVLLTEAARRSMTALRRLRAAVACALGRHDDHLRYDYMTSRAYTQCTRCWSHRADR